jgi:hypothetical protein
MPNLKLYCALFLILISSADAFAQPITGNWKGRLNGRKVELKIIQNGDSLTGSAFYFESANMYTRYSIKGYFDQADNSVVWWDEQLLEQKGSMIFNKANPLLSVADFNCPGGGKMYLNGKTADKNDPEKKNGTVGLTKAAGPNFPDEWDYVIENYTVGANDPWVIDSIEKLVLLPRETIIASAPKPALKKKPGMVYIPPMRNKKETVVKETIPDNEPVAVKEITIEEKFRSREKIINTEIPVSGDSVELRFYDNAQVDGDSISLFLGDKLLFEHIRLTEKPYSIKLAVSQLDSISLLTMVAENLGSIPPNTSYMVAIVGEKHYSAYLASTENSSAMIRLKKE